MADEPTWAEVIRELVADELGELYTMIPGEVVSFSHAEQTAVVAPVVKRPDGATLPNAIDVPVCYPSAYYDLAAGEVGALICSIYDWRRWWRTEQLDEPETQATYSLGSALFLPGLRSLVGARTYTAGAKVLEGNDVRLGGDAATDYVVIQALLDGLFTLYGFLTTWVGQVDVAAGPLAGTAGLQGQINVVRNAITAGSYQATKVKAE